MIAEHAGLRNLERIDLYLTNLGRLGMIEFSKEQVRNPTRYQVIEAQPKVVDAHEERRPHAAHRPAQHPAHLVRRGVRAHLPAAERQGRAAARPAPGPSPQVQDGSTPGIVGPGSS